MKVKLFFLHLLILLIIELPVSLTAQNSIYYTWKTLHANNIIINSNNIGSLDQRGAAYYDLIPDDNKQIVYDHSLWVIGKINNLIHAGFAAWFNTYSPGPIIDGNPSMIIHPEDSLKYRVYKIAKGDDETNIDYAEWPFEYGAPADEFGRPKISGDQMLWTVYNALDSSVYYTYRNPAFGSRPPFPVEIQHSVYAREGNYDDNVDLFSNVVFLEWTIINKGSNTIDSAYISLWTDIDFNYIFENRPAVDTINQLGYCWGNPTGYFPISNKAVGYVLLFGPVVQSPGNTAIFRGIQLENYKNLELSSFHAIVDDGPPIWPPDDPAQNLTEAWNIARGYDTEGNQILDPISGSITNFIYPGNPATNEGWFFGTETGGGAGFNMFCGPFTMAPQDTQWVMMALIPAMGEDYIESIKVLKNKAAILRSIPYDSLAFGSTPITVSVNDEGKNVPVSFKLFQNYPNPFNATTVISYSLPNTVYDGLNVKLEVFDLLGRKAATLVDELKLPGHYEIEFDASGLTSGIYFYKLTNGIFSTVKKLLLLK